MKLPPLQTTMSFALECKPMPVGARGRQKESGALTLVLFVVLAVVSEIMKGENGGSLVLCLLSLGRREAQ